MSDNLAECSRCGGTGFQVRRVNGYDRASSCDCRRNHVGHRLLESARIPIRYRDCDLDSYAAVGPGQRRAKQRAIEFVDTYPDVDGGILFAGSCGVGKTHLAVGILRALIVDKGTPGLFVDFRDLLKQIQDTYSPVNRVSASQVLRPLFSTEVLVLDDLGASKPTDWVRDTLGHIVNRRYNEEKPTIVTTVYGDQMAPAPDSSAIRPESLADRVGAALRSRLEQMCEMVTVPGDDFRQTVAGQSTRRGADDGGLSTNTRRSHG